MAEQKKEPIFRNKYLGPLVWLAFILVVFLVPRIEGMPINGVYVPESLGQWLLMIMPVLSFVLVARAGGLDWSIMPVYSLCSVLAAQWMQDGNPAVLVLALFTGALCGAVNGLLCVLGGLPSVIVTLITGTLISHITYIFSSGITGTLRLQADSVTVLTILCAILAVVAFLLNLLTPLGRPMRKRQEPVIGERLSYFLAYVFASMLAGATGMLSIGVLEGTTPGAQLVSMDFLTVLLFAGCSVLFDNRVMPLIMAAVGRVLLWALTSGYSVGNLSIGWQYFVIWGMMILAFMLDRVYLRNYTADFLRRNKVHIPWPKKSGAADNVDDRENEGNIVQNITAETVVINNSSSEASQNIVSEANIVTEDENDEAAITADVTDASSAFESFKAVDSADEK